jgi:uncharacterized protein
MGFQIVARVTAGALAALACTTVGSSAWAQAQRQAPAQATPGIVNPNPSPAAISIAKEIITLKGGAQMFDSVVPGVIETTKNQFIPTNPNLNKPLNDVAEKLRKDFDSKKGEVLNEVARVYARRFTEQELKELIAFYRTALGKKILVEEPAAIEDGLKRAQDWANDFSEQVIARMRNEMKKLGYDL